MNGPTLAMGPAAIDSPTSPFHRSHSTPNLLSYKDLPSLPAFDVPSFDPDPDFHSSLILASKSAAAAARPDKPVRRNSLLDRPRSWIPSTRSSPDVRDLAVRQVGPPIEDAVAEAVVPIERPRTVSGSFADFARRSWISSSASRSPSPKGRSPSTLARESRKRASSGGSPTPNGRLSGRRVFSTGGSDTSAPSDSPSSTTRALNRASVYLTRIKQRPQSVFIKSVSSPLPTSNDEKATGLETSESLGSRLRPDKRHTLPPRASRSHSSSESSADESSASTPPTGSETESNTSVDTAPTPSRSATIDPLWAAFKELDGQHAKFAAKQTTAQKMLIVRAALIPFLRRHGHGDSHEDTKRLSPADVERRAMVLNKWWTGMLEMLDSASGRMLPTTPGSVAPSLQPVAGVDRPGLLDATAMIMMRPEWRLNTSVFRPLADRSPNERVRARSNTADSKVFDEAGSQFLDDSAEHNVRTMFVNNLVSQMALVVDRMSLRHAPLSLVNFSGKACAYAFFFVPGAAEVLVRLWGLDKNLDLIRRMADVIGLPRRSKGESDDIVALFPPNLGSLGWTSVSAMGLKLRRTAKLGIQLSRIPWRGPWLSRWRGGDTDLFFIFCKYFFVLADEFMPAELPLVEKARAPAYVLLLAQLLQILDSTIHRQSAVDAIMGPPMPDTLLGEDAAITALPTLLPSNLLRGMDENRMIVLLKDFLSADESMAGARHTFAQSFSALLEAATRRTSQYDHNAAYMLCDFLEQTLLAFDGYFGYSSQSNTEGDGDGLASNATAMTDYINWPFWFDVFKMILASNNTMSEIRLLSFVFSTWDIIAADTKRKEDMCVNWLLREDVFEKLFNNWCPMVRAYYMRLLCWRMCRDGGSANGMDERIFAVTSQRLRTVWSHYLWLRQEALMEGTLAPSTAPCLPQPGRRFMIVRTEVGVPQPGLFVGFDAKSGSSFDGGDQPGGALSGLGSVAADRKLDSSSSAKRKWSLLGKVLSFTSSATLPTNGVAGPKPTIEEQFEQVRKDIASARFAANQTKLHVPVSGAPQPPPKQSGSPAVTPGSDADSTGSSPVYEPAQYVFRFTLHNIPWQAGPNGMAPPLFRDRILTRPRLPAPAQARVSARAAAAGKRSESPPPPAAGLPPVTRRVSGLMMGGLVNGARNARPEESVPVDDSSSGSLRMSIGSRTVSSDSRPSIVDDDMDRPGRQSPSGGSDREGEPQQTVQPVEPKGASALAAKYAGRALAEWSMVVSECNSFVDRRRDEGVLGLSDVEVPTLGVEGLRRLA
jgi:hypothetical protein